MATIYIDEDVGKDEPTQQGTEESPYKTLQFAYLQRPGETQYLTRKSQDAADEAAKEWKPAAKSALKKAVNYFEQQKKKAARELELVAQRKKVEEERSKVLEEAKAIVIEEDSSLPAPVRIRLDEVGEPRQAAPVRRRGEQRHPRARARSRASRAEAEGRPLRHAQGRLRLHAGGHRGEAGQDLRCHHAHPRDVDGDLRWRCTRCPPALTPRSTENSTRTSTRSPSTGRRRAATTPSPTGSRPAPEQSTLLDLRHLTLRGEVASSVMLVRDAVEYAFNQAYKEIQFGRSARPPWCRRRSRAARRSSSSTTTAPTPTSPRSSQLYLETCLASMGNVYRIEKSFRAEKSLTRRHLSEFTHIEAELDFIDFNDLLDHIEHLMCRVLEIVMADPVIAEKIMALNPEFKVPQRPFMRMKYEDAIKWLQGARDPQRRGQPTRLRRRHRRGRRAQDDRHHQPTYPPDPLPFQIKSFYMLRDPTDDRVTESVDCLMPGVGEIVGGSMRLDDHEKLMAAFERGGSTRGVLLVYRPEKVSIPQPLNSREPP